MAKGRKRTLEPTLSPITATAVLENEERRAEQEVENIKQELVKTTPVDTEHFIDEMNIDKYIDRATEDNDVLKAEFEVEKNDLLEKISKLESEIAKYRNRIDDLETENKNLQSKIDGSDYNSIVEKCNRLDKDNDDLLLKNSELMFNISKLECALRDVQSKLDKQYHYTKKPANMATSLYLVNQKISQSMNGYEDWRD